MDLSKLITPELCFSGVDCKSKKRVLSNLAEYVNGIHPNLPVEDIYSGLIQREKLGSTGIGLGVAIPHCRVSHCDEMIGVLLQLTDPVDFDAIDGQPADLIFALIVPTESNQEHLDALSQIAALFNNKKFLNDLRKCKAERELYDTLIENAGLRSGTENPA